LKSGSSAHAWLAFSQFLPLLSVYVTKRESKVAGDEEHGSGGAATHGIYKTLYNLYCSVCVK